MVACPDRFLMLRDPPLIGLPFPLLPLLVGMIFCPEATFRNLTGLQFPMPINPDGALEVALVDPSAYIPDGYVVQFGVFSY